MPWWGWLLVAWVAGGTSLSLIWLIVIARFANKVWSR